MTQLSAMAFCLMESVVTVRLFEFILVHLTEALS